MKSQDRWDSVGFVSLKHAHQVHCHRVRGVWVGWGARRLLPLAKRDHAQLDRPCAKQVGQDDPNHARLSPWHRTSWRDTSLVRQLDPMKGSGQ
jgi:hypothetical protein